MNLFSGGKPSMESRLADAETKSGFFTALCAAIVLAFSLNDEKKDALEAGDATVFAGALESFKQTLAAPLVALRLAIAEAFGFDGEMIAAVANGDFKPITAIHTAFAAAETQLETLRKNLGKALELTDEQVAALDEKGLTDAINKVAGKKAIDLAGSQGVPTPVPTAAADAGASADDEIATLRDQAAAEPDARKRATLHAKADRLADQRKHASDN